MTAPNTFFLFFLIFTIWWVIIFDIGISWNILVVCLLLFPYSLILGLRSLIIWLGLRAQLGTNGSLVIEALIFHSANNTVNKRVIVTKYLHFSCLKFFKSIIMPVYMKLCKLSTQLMISIPRYLTIDFIIVTIYFSSLDKWGNFDFVIVAIYFQCKYGI